MLRHLVLVFAPLPRAGCATGYSYRDGYGAYYYGQPSVDYDDYGYGAPYGSIYGYPGSWRGGRLRIGYGYGRYGYGGNYGYPYGYYGGGYPYYPPYWRYRPHRPHRPEKPPRSEERRVGEECGRPGRSRWSADH